MRSEGAKKSYFPDNLILKKALNSSLIFLSRVAWVPSGNAGADLLCLLNRNVLFNYLCVFLFIFIVALIFLLEISKFQDDNSSYSFLF